MGIFMFSCYVEARGGIMQSVSARYTGARKIIRFSSWYMWIIKLMEFLHSCACLSCHATRSASDQLSIRDCQHPCRADTPL